MRDHFQPPTLTSISKGTGCRLLFRFHPLSFGRIPRSPCVLTDLASFLSKTTMRSSIFIILIFVSAPVLAWQQGGANFQTSRGPVSATSGVHFGRVFRVGGTYLGAPPAPSRWMFRRGLPQSSNPSASERARSPALYERDDAVNLPSNNVLVRRSTGQPSITTRDDTETEVDPSKFVGKAWEGNHLYNRDTAPPRDGTPDELNDSLQRPLQ
ncbi:hypothetical protein F5148DRAFT_807492 [Russula earlei]|uniref:Uncharacterized protein n=1 Tax=Russula earlei TaxID=71964 RepID=A0ACC0UE28_9AGAM|nr:hypothetical protein F5148DRAFT_807492 [Russula earlei]